MEAQNFREQFHAALIDGVSHDELVQVVILYKNSGVDQRSVYNQLQNIREEIGCDEDECENTNCDRIEYVMDLVWGFCRKEKMIWETSLTTNACE